MILDYTVMNTIIAKEQWHEDMLSTDNYSFSSCCANLRLIYQPTVLHIDHPLQAIGIHPLATLGDILPPGDEQ